MKIPVCLLGAGLLFGACPAFAQQTASSRPLMSPGSETDFMPGLRRVGVLAGQAVICSSEADRQHQIEKVAAAGNLIATEFGLRAAFNFIGAAGYGSGAPFAESGCANAIKQWTEVQQRYGEN